MKKYKKILFPEPLKATIVEDEINDENIPAGNVLVKSVYSLVSAGTERACFRGTEAWFKLPNTPGYADVGIVVGKAEDVTDLKIGDYIFFRGKHAEYQYLDEKNNYSVLPDGLDRKVAPFARMFAIAMSSTRASDIELGDDVLIIGQGLIGNAAAQLAQAQGANVLVTDVDDSRLEISAKCGLTGMNTATIADPISAVTEYFHGRKPSTVIDATGVPAVIDSAIDYAEMGGILILLGSPRGDYTANLTHFEQHIHQFRYRVNVIGAHEQTVPNKPMPYVKHSCERNERISLELMKQGKLIVEPLISRIEKPEECETVYKELDKGNPAYLGVLFDWND